MAIRKGKAQKRLHDRAIRPRPLAGRRERHMESETQGSETGEVNRNDIDRPEPVQAPKTERMP